MREITWSVKCPVAVVVATVGFADRDFLLECKISAIWRSFLLTLHFIYWRSAISTASLFNLLTCRVTAFLSADTSRDLVTLTFDLLTLNSCHTWRVTWQTLPPSLKTLCLSVLELGLWVITLPVGYHWKCVRGQCACGESRDRPRFIETTVCDVSVIFYASNLLRFCLLSKHFTTSVK